MKHHEGTFMVGGKAINDKEAMANVFGYQFFSVSSTPKWMGKTGHDLKTVLLRLAMIFRIFGLVIAAKELLRPKTLHLNCRWAFQTGRCMTKMFIHNNVL